MLAFEVWVNGNKLYTVASESAESYGIDLSCHPKVQSDIASFEASGYVDSESAYPDELRWGSKHLKQGDELVVKVINTTSPDQAARTKYEGGLIPEDNHAMLCSNCGKSQFDTNRFIRAERISLCMACASAITEMTQDE